jgi:molybdopterin/thiamine biosynthesis adenylyltransferase
VAAVVAGIEATEVVKLLVDPGSRNRQLLVLDLWDVTFDKLEVPRDPSCVCCGSGVLAGADER